MNLSRRAGGVRHGSLTSGGAPRSSREARFGLTIYALVEKGLFMRSPMPKQFSREYADIFRDQSVVDAYRFRPTYPAGVFEILRELIDPKVPPRAILDAGCGTGFLARELAAFGDRVDAVDISENMIRAGKELPGGDSPKLNWICGAIEEATLQSDPG